jgi:Uncharacterised nucleotidyltransferase
VNQVNTNELMRRLAGATPPHKGRIAELLPAVDFAELARELSRQRLLGLLGSRLLKAGGEDVPRQFAVAVRRSLEHSREQSAANAMLTWSLLAELEAAGTRAVPLKGPFLAERLHGDPALRQSDDVDLLVSARDMPSAIATLERIGAVRPRHGDGLPQLHHHFRIGDGAPIELHWRIYWFDRSYTDRLLARTVRYDELWRPSAVDELASLLLFHARDGLIGLRAPADIAVCWARHHDSATVEGIRSIAREHPGLAPALAAAAESVSRVLDLDLAATIALPAIGRTAVAVELTDWTVRRQSRELDLTVKLVDALVTPRQGLLAFVRRTFLPRLEGPRSSRLFRQVAHAAALLVRVAIAAHAIRRHLRTPAELRLSEGETMPLQ